MHQFVKKPACQATASHPRLAPIAAVRQFFAEHGPAIATASCFLGGTSAANRNLRLTVDLREAKKLTRHLRNELVALHRLLTLENVSDPDTIESSCFATIDPEDPIIWELCLLADQVADLLRAIACDDGKELAGSIVVPKAHAA